MKYLHVSYEKQTIYMWNNKRRNVLCNISALLLNRSLWDACCLQAAQSHLLLIINIFLDYWVRTHSSTLSKPQTAGMHNASHYLCPSSAYRPI